MMRTLFNEPFDIQSGSLIEIRGQAKNEFGWGQFSEVNPRGVRLIAKPPQITELKLAEKNIDSVIVAWDPVDNESTEIIYTLQWWSTSDPTAIKNRRLFMTSYLVEELTPGKSYQFHVRASTRCRNGVFSPILDVTLADVPSQLNPIHTEVQKCHVHFDWDGPESSSSPVTGYTVEVRGGSFENFYVVPECSVIGDIRRCEVPMKTLRKIPI